MIRRPSRMVAGAVLLVLSVSLLGGCSTLKKFTGQRNDTVLPGQREEILTPEQTKREDPNVTSGDATQQPASTADAPCDPSVQDCPPTVDQEAGDFEG